MSLVSKQIVYFSVTNTLNDEKRDLRVPFSFLDFIKYTGVNDKENELENYKAYLKEWEAYTNISLTSINVNVKDQFIAFLEEVKLLFFNNEEKRYFDNLDFNDDEQVSIAIPFFTTKIKEISQYYKKKRESITGNLQYIKRKGSPQGAERFIKELIFDIYSGDDIDPGLRRPEDLESFINTIDIGIERFYDTFNDYYDLDPKKSPEFYDVTSGNRYNFFSSNTNTLSSNFYINEDRAISDVINEQGIGLKEIPGLKVLFDTSDLQYLDDNKFIDQKNTGKRSDLNLNYEKDIPINYLGSDMYYVSSNSTGDYKFEKLFDAAFPHRNLLNINNPTTISVPGNSFANERTVGLFFKPSNRGILKMECDFTTSLLEIDIDKNTTYVFPDPGRYGNISGVGASSKLTPITFNTTFNRFRNASSSYGKSLPEVDSKDQTMHSYNTAEQRLFKPNSFTPLRELELLEDVGTIYKEVGDIFGNKFYLINNTLERNRNLDNFTETASPLDLYNTRTITLSTSNEKETISSIRNKLKTLKVYNIIDNKIDDVPSKFAKIFNRYTFNTELYGQLTSNSFQDLDIFVNTFFIKTNNYFIIDNIGYNKSGTFFPQAFSASVKNYNKGIIVNQQTTPISNISNPFEVGDDIYYVQLISNPNTTSPSNLKFFEFNLFKYNKKKQTEINLITANTQNESYFLDNFTFNLNSNIVEISNVKISYNNKLSKFICTTNYRDLNNTSFIHVLIFDINGNVLEINSNYVITPDNFVETVNFFIDGLVGTSNTDSKLLKSRYILTQPTQDKTYGTFRF